MGSVIAMPYCGSPAQFQWNAPYSTMPGCQPCPPYPPPCTGPPPLFGPIVGVIDGSKAAPGMVGEVITWFATVAYAAYPADTITTVSLLVAPPGDWDFFLVIAASTSVGAIIAYLSPQPVGMLNSMGIALEDFAPSIFSQQIAALYSYGIGNFSVPTLLPFSINISQGSSNTLPAGTAYLTIYGRRRR